MNSIRKRNQTVWVMHAGALGDWVMIWPLLRSLARGGLEVVAVSHLSKAKLAARWIDGAPGSIVVLPGGIDQPQLSGWWAGPREDDSPARQRDWRAPVPARIVNFLCDASTPAGRSWHAAAAAEFPGVSIETVGPPGSSSRAALWSREQVAVRGTLAGRENRDGPIVCHIGAGSNEKRWPLNGWATVARSLVAQGRSVELIAGEVESERLTGTERADFSACRGRFIHSLDDLASTIAAARLFIGCDTGPTHLAAQLGIPTIALFGPTDPMVWSPTGPAVQTLSPPAPRPMDWLDPDRVLAALNRLGAYTLPP